MFLFFNPRMCYATILTKTLLKMKFTNGAYFLKLRAKTSCCNQMPRTEVAEEGAAGMTIANHQCTDLPRAPGKVLWMTQTSQREGLPFLVEKKKESNFLPREVK